MAAPHPDPGAVRLDLRWRAGRACEVRLRSARPEAAALMRGRLADEAVRMLPLLYAICGAAQGVAARLALTAARGAPVAAAVDADVLAEVRREHLWRLLLDWPQALGLQPHESLLAEGRRRSRQPDFTDWVEAALREPLAQIEQALHALPTPAPARTRLLPPLTAAQTLAPWPQLGGDFAASPMHEGAPAETGALARHADLAELPPLLARIRARAADLAGAETLGRASAATVMPGVGRAAVETARGLLLHEIVLDGERVADYRIVAPTEWNFHPAGVLAQWLDGATAVTPEDLKALAARSVLALDPCVRADITVNPD